MQGCCPQNPTFLLAPLQLFPLAPSPNLSNEGGEGKVSPCTKRHCFQAWSSDHLVTVYQA